MKSLPPIDPTADEVRPVTRRFSVVVQLADPEDRHPRVRLTLPRLRRDLSPSRRTIIATLRAAERAGWSSDAGHPCQP